MSKAEEEKHPLLLYIVEPNDELSKTNKRYFDRGRLHGITSGATAVFKQFPMDLTIVTAHKLRKSKYNFFKSN
ncbi:hypothetical protein NQ315_001517 [Exocentrus adspersus]|uniref:Uncharacterized protein n=1 Tax=Exocentrus adspersus TaxID=1586481 RepID=A0AAV8W9T3_9CUCU|nr:hypothetical protein NQ315_001517 [Exocentrus adspersus]